MASGVFYGLIPGYFHPREEGRNYEMPPVLGELRDHKRDFTIFSGLDHNIGGGHNATKFFLSGIPLSHAKGYAEGNISLDQKAALHVGRETRFPSLVLGCESGTGNALSWTRNASPVPQISRVSQLYDMLFGKPRAEQLQRQERELKDRRSILDLVQGQAKSFRKDLGKEDSEKLEQYFTSVRELEQRVEQSEQWLGREKPSTEMRRPEGIDSLPLRQKTAIFYDLMVLALQTDSTRVITLSFLELGKEQGGLQGVTSGYHSLSHHGKEQKTIDELAIIEAFYVREFGHFLTKLKQVKETDGASLFDHTMSLFGSGMSNGNSHSNRDLPVVLAGGGMKHGEHRTYARNGRSSVPLCNLYVTML
ncbi:MAG: DUF1552 domain-containing protein, partial [Verrucomicrobiota bacterium]